jgi:hypothetical protein
MARSARQVASAYARDLFNPKLYHQDLPDLHPNHLSGRQSAYGVFRGFPDDVTKLRRRGSL